MVEDIEREGDGVVRTIQNLDRSLCTWNRLQTPQDRGEPPFEVVDPPLQDLP